MKPGYFFKGIASFQPFQTGLRKPQADSFRHLSKNTKDGLQSLRRELLIYLKEGNRFLIPIDL
jgi:hypothetical protein